MISVVIYKYPKRDANADFQAVSDAIFSRLQAEFEMEVSLRVVSGIKFQLSMFDEKKKGAATLISALETLVNGIDEGAIYSQTLEEFNAVIFSKNLEILLSPCNRKSLCAIDDITIHSTGFARNGCR